MTPPDAPSAEAAKGPQVSAKWGIVLFFATTLTMVTWWWLLTATLWFTGLLLLSWVGGHELVSLGCWPAADFGSAARSTVFSLVLGAVLLECNTLWAHLRKRPRAPFWRTVWPAWFVVTIAHLVLGVLLDHVGLLPTWEARGVLLGWTGWALLFPLWSVWLQLRWGAPLWRQATRRRWLAWLLIVLGGVGGLTAVGLPLAAVVQAATQSEAEAREGDRALRSLSTVMERIWYAADTKWGDQDQLAEAPRFIRAIMSLTMLRKSDWRRAAKHAKKSASKRIGIDWPPTVPETVQARTKPTVALPTIKLKPRTPRGYVLALSWQPAFCRNGGASVDPQQCRRPRNAFVIHGLWPYRARGRTIICRTGPGFDERDYLASDQPMPSVRLAKVEWQRHGRCLGWPQRHYFRETQQHRRRVRLSRPWPGGRGLLWYSPNELGLLRVHTSRVGGSRWATPRMVHRCKGRELVEMWTCFDRDSEPTDCPRQLRSNCGERVMVRRL